jgi:hypothetical protein
MSGRATPSRAVTVKLMGGLGNQMFQYAAASALAINNGADLCVDSTTGFRHDAFRRGYELQSLPIRARSAGWTRRAPFSLERAFFFERRMLRTGRSQAVRKRPWGTYLFETELRYLDEVASCRLARDAWVDGYWQSEQYFLGSKEQIAEELMPPAPSDPLFLGMAEQMRSGSSVAVGVRLFEEMPGAAKSGVGGLTPMSFYDEAAAHAAAAIRDPVFFVFSTTRSPALEQLKFPGRVHYVTQDDGFHATVPCLWLLTQCENHILSNSSFYWWGAWLSEHRSGGAFVAASSLFPNRDTIPKRWLTLGASR